MSLDKLIAAATDYFTTGAELNRRNIESAVKNQAVLDAYEALGPKVGTTIDTPVPKPKAKAKVETVTDVVEKLSEKDQAALDAYEADAAAARARDSEVAAAAAAAAADDLDGTTTVNYEEDIRPLIRTKSLANRDGLVALLATFGAKSGAELTADQHAPFFAQLKAL